MCRYLGRYLGGLLLPTSVVGQMQAVAFIPPALQASIEPQE